MRKHLLYLLASLALVSCATPDSDENQPAQLFCLPTQVTNQTIYQDGRKESVESRYTYNNKGELDVIKFYDISGLVQEYTFEYNSEGRIIRENTFLANGDLTDYTTYEHDAAGKVTSSSIYLYDPEQQKATLYRKHDWSYASPTQLSTMLSYREDNGQLRQVLRYTYTYQNGLMTQVHTYSTANQLVQETSLTYDNGHAMLLGLERFRLNRVGEGFPHTHNVVQKVVKDLHGEVMASFSFNSELTYSDKGYRTSSLAHYGDGIKRESQVVYNCP
jgi:hypothetical protein